MGTGPVAPAAPCRAMRCRSAKSVDADGRRPAPPTRTAAAAPCSKPCESGFDRSGWAATAPPAPREPRPPRSPATAGILTRAGAAATYATAQYPRMPLQVAASFDSVIMNDQIVHVDQRYA